MNDNKIIFQSLHNIDKSMYDLIFGPNSPFISFVSIGTSLLLLLTMIMIARMAYKMMVLDGKLDILNFIRPVLISVVLAYWPLVTTTLNSFAHPVENYFMKMYENTATELYALREQRIIVAKSIGNKLQDEKTKSDISGIIADNIIKEKETEEDGSENKSGFAKTISEFFAPTYHITDINLLAKSLTISNSYMSKFFESIIFWIGEIYWEVCSLYIFLLKNCFLAALVVVGPVTIACSMLPTWKDSWKNWLGRMVTVSFYGVLAYIVMVISMYLIRFGLETDVKTLTRIAGDDLALYSLVKYDLGLAGTVCLYFISLFVGGTALLMVPTLADWVFPSQGIKAAGNFLHGMIGTTVAVAATTAKVAISAVTGTPLAETPDTSEEDIEISSSEERNPTRIGETTEDEDIAEEADRGSRFNENVNEMNAISEDLLLSELSGNNREEEDIYKNILEELEKMEQESLISKMIIEASAYRHDELEKLEKRYRMEGKSEREFLKMAIQKTWDDLSLLQRGLTEYKEAILIGQERAFFLLYPHLKKSHLSVMLREKENIEKELANMLARYKALKGNSSEILTINKEIHAKDIRQKLLSALIEEITLYEDAVINENKDSFMRMRGYTVNDIAMLYGKYREFKGDNVVESNSIFENLDSKRAQIINKLSNTDQKSVYVRKLKQEETEYINTFRLLKQMANIHNELEAYEDALKENRVNEFMQNRGYTDSFKSQLEKELEELERKLEKKLSNFKNI